MFGGEIKASHRATAAKAAIQACRAPKPGGRAVLVVRHTGVNPIGSPEYKQTLAMLKDKGPAGFTLISIKRFFSPPLIWKGVRDVVNRLALVLGERVAVMRAGRIEQIGTPAEV